MNLWLLGAKVAGSAAVTVVLLYLIRRRSRVDFFFVDIARGAGVFAVIGTAFAVILAFVVLDAFQSFNDAWTGAEREASLVLTLSRTAEFFPPGERAPLEGDLMCYGRAVIHEEWPAMKDGRRSPVVQAWVVRMQGALKELDPESPKEQAAFENLLDQVDQRTLARDSRLTEAERHVPAPVWFFLIVGAAVTVGYGLFFADRREHLIVQGFLVASVTILVVSGVLLVWFLDRPYDNGTGSIKPDQMGNALATVGHEQMGVARPCDQNGQTLEQRVQNGETTKPGSSFRPGTVPRTRRRSSASLMPPLEASQLFSARRPARPSAGGAGRAPVWPP